MSKTYSRRPQGISSPPKLTINLSDKHDKILNSPPRPAVTQTYKRKSKKERVVAQQRAEEETNKKLSKSRAQRAEKKRNIQKTKNISICSQIMRREITGIQTEVKCNRPYKYSAIDSLIILQRGRLTGSPLVRLTSVIESDKELKTSILNGTLCLMGFAKGNEKYQVPLIGYQTEIDSSHDPSAIGWQRDLWKKTIDLYFIDIFFKSQHFAAKIPTPVQPARNQAEREKRATIGRSSSFSSRNGTGSEKQLSRSQSLIEKTVPEIKLKIVTKSVPYVKLIRKVSCCTLPMDVNQLFVHQAMNEKIFILFNGKKEVSEGKKKQKKLEKKKDKKVKSVLPNSLAEKLKTQKKKDTMDYKLTHYLPSLENLNEFAISSSLNLSSPETVTVPRVENNQHVEYEETEGFITILPSPLYYCDENNQYSSLNIHFQAIQDSGFFQPKFCYFYGNNREKFDILLNLQHSLFIISVSILDQAKFISDLIEDRKNKIPKFDLLNFKYFPECDDAMSIIDIDKIYLFDVDRFLYEIIPEQFYERNLIVTQFSTQILLKFSEEDLFIQLLFFSQKRTENIIIEERGGVLFALNILSKQTSVVYLVPLQKHPNSESVHTWASRMAELTKNIGESKNEIRIPDHSWDNSPFINAEPVKHLAHPTIPLILVNDLPVRPTQ